MLAKGSLLLLLVMLIGAIAFAVLSLQDDGATAPAGLPLTKPIAQAPKAPLETAVPAQQASPQPDATQLLAKAMSTSAAERTFHFVLDKSVAALPDAPDSAMQIAVTGQFHAPDRIEGSVVLSTSADSAAIDFIIIDSAVYVRDHEDGAWQQPDIETLIAQLILDNASLAVRQFSQGAPSNPIVVDEPLLYGLPVYHVRGVLLGESEREQRPSAGTIDFWISKEDNRIYRIKSDSDSPGSGKVQLQVDYAAFGTPVLIAAPRLADAGNAADPLRVADSDLLQEQ